MEGTAIFDLPTWGGPFNPYKFKQTHSIILFKLEDNPFLGMPNVSAWVFFYIIIGFVQNLANSESYPIMRLL